MTTKSKKSKTVSKKKKATTMTSDAGFVKFVKELQLIKEEFPGFEIKSKKDSKFCSFIKFLLTILTFGKCDFDKFSTLFGLTLYVCDSWNNLMWIERYVIICHERLHLRQIRKCGFGNFTIGKPIFSLLYLFLPLPIFFTFRGFWFEKEAYQESTRLLKENKMNYNLDDFVKQFTGPNYFWMFPFKKTVTKWMK